MKTLATILIFTMMSLFSGAILATCNGKIVLVNQLSTGDVTMNGDKTFCGPEPSDHITSPGNLSNPYNIVDSYCANNSFAACKGKTCGPQIGKSFPTTEKELCGKTLYLVVSTDTDGKPTSTLTPKKP